MLEALEEDYNSASDEDFRPEAQDANEDQDRLSSSESDANAKEPKPKKRKSAPTADETDLGFDNSGDEATIQKGRKKRRPLLDEDDGGEGGLVKTRAQRRLEEKEKKPLLRTDGATVDVDALWASMSAPKTASAPNQHSPAALGDGIHTPEDRTGRSDLAPPAKVRIGAVTGTLTSDKPAADAQEASNGESKGQDLITIKRTYEFAGEMITEERTVHKDSAEARLYLESQSTKPPSTPDPDKPPLRRPKKRVSMFEPNPTGAVAGLPASASKGPKLNTIEKSKLDWAGYVDKEGIADELNVHKKGKEGYLERMEFLNRMDAKRE